MNDQVRIGAASEAINETVAHARSMLASQASAVQAEKLDFTPQFVEGITHHYLIGVMWRFNEKYDFSGSARDRAYVCMTSLLEKNGASLKNAERRVGELYRATQIPEGQQNLAALAVSVGYKAEPGDGSLAALLVASQSLPSSARVTKAIWRQLWQQLDRAMAIAVVLFVAGTLLSLLFGRSFGIALGVGAVLGISAIVVGYVLFRQAIKLPRE